MDIQFAKYKELIEQQLEELAVEDVLGQSAQKTVELDQQSVGRLSRMDALQSQAMAQAQQRRRDAHKQALQAALRRLAEDEFGYCMECGEEIEEARLLTNPANVKAVWWPILGGVVSKTICGIKAIELLLVG